MKIDLFNLTAEAVNELDDYASAIREADIYEDAESVLTEALGYIKALETVAGVLDVNVQGVHEYGQIVHSWHRNIYSVMVNKAYETGRDNQTIEQLAETQEAI